MRRFASRLLIFALAVLVVLIGAGALLYTRLPDPDTLLQPPARPSILILDRNGRTLYEAIDRAGSKHVPLSLAAIPMFCRQATIATEDANFYRHPGFDLLAIARAVWLNLRAGETVSGASTLTQQLARNLLMSEAERSEQTLGRKIREAWLAWRLERRHPKDELLALYLNTTYYGHYARGIEAASQAYFGVHASELDLAQCALLAGLPQWPAGYNPIENLEAARARQATVLRLMMEQGAISAEQAQEAREETLKFASTPFPIEAPHFVMYVQSQLEALLPSQRLAQGGLRVITTLDLDWQRAGESAVRRRISQLRPCAGVRAALARVNCDPHADPARRVENAALVSLDPTDGAIRALVGSPDYFDAAASGAVNAALAQRQPGSAIKPLTYALALDPAAAAKAGRPTWTAATILPDIRTSFSTAEGAPYTPNNYDRRFHGPVTVRTALANSYNVPAVATLNTVGVENLVNLARDLGIPWERANRVTGEGEKPRYGLSLTLGGGEVRLIDLTAAYAAFARGGYRVAPYAIQRIETLDGKAVWSQADAAAAVQERVLDQRIAFLITDILSDDLARRPAFGEGSSLDIGRPAAAKTGTTTDWRDNWTVGFTPDVVTGVWVGNADNTPMKDVSGITGAGPIWHDFMASVLATQPVTLFSVPEGVVQQAVCADSGLLPLDGPRPVEAAGATLVPCPDHRLEWFIAGTEPTELDRQHVRVLIDSRTGRIAQLGDPNGRPQVYWQLGPEYQAWARENDVPQAPVLAGRPADVASLSPTHNVLRLISPDPGRVLRIDPGLPLDAQQLPVIAQPEFPAGEVTLTVDGRAFAVVRPPEYTAWWPLTTGRHVLGAWAESSDGNRILSPEVVVTVIGN